MNKKEKTYHFFKEQVKFPLSFSEIALMLGVNDEPTLSDILNELVLEGKIIKNGKGKYFIEKNEAIIFGEFIKNERGFGFLSTENSSFDYFIAKNDSKNAIDGDYVRAKKTKKSKGEREEAYILNVVKRKERRFAGVFFGKDAFGYVMPNDKKLPDEIYISENIPKAQYGDRVLCEIITDDIVSCSCRIISVIGKENDIGIDVLMCILEHGANEEFPENVIRAAKRCPKCVDTTKIGKRTDFTDEIIFTIDGEDAKDLDDAVGIRRKKNGNFELGVHIADVGEYVKYNSVIDKEALLRGTSIYPVDRVVPMLPRELSNGICSLNPKVLRLTLSVIMEIDKCGNVLNKKICQGVIKSKYRLSYKEVNDILEGKKSTTNKYSEILDDIHLMNELAKILYNKRKERGAIDFDFPESRAILDENGRCIDICKLEKGISNGIIEEFMLVCNETVAKFLCHEMKMPAIFRVHEAPDEDKLSALKRILKPFNIAVENKDGKIAPKNFQKIINLAKEKKEAYLIETSVLRSMMKAEYKNENLGHFGLALGNYCHFTSPIRRYPDLVIHRIIKDILNNKKIDKDKLFNFTNLASEKSTNAEIRAMEIERETLEMKKAEFLSAFIGETFVGKISSVTSFGFYVMLDNTIEGLVKMADLHDDYYEFFEDKMYIKGVQRNKIYALGDEVKICVIRSDAKSREIDFVICGNKQINFRKKEKSIDNKNYKRDKRKNNAQKNLINKKRFLKKKSRRKRK